MALTGRLFTITVNMDTEREIGVVPYDALLLDAQAEGEDLTETIFDYADAKKVLLSAKISRGDTNAPQKRVSG